MASYIHALLFLTSIGADQLGFGFGMQMMVHLVLEKRVICIVGRW